MPAPIDLTGRRFGKLEVIGQGPRVFWGRWQSSWVCRCDCGGQVTVPLLRLPYRRSISPGHRVEACDDCRAHPCEVCGTPIPAASLSKTCSVACGKERERQYQLAYYHGVRVNDQDDTERRRSRSRDRRHSKSPEERSLEDKRRYDKELAARGRDALRRENREQYHARMATEEGRTKHRAAIARWQEDNRDKVRAAGRSYVRRRRAASIAAEIASVIAGKDKARNDE